MSDIRDLLNRDSDGCDTPMVTWILGLPYGTPEVPFTWDDITYAPVDDDEAEEDAGYDEHDIGNIMEWWAVSDFLFEELKKNVEFYIENPWWPHRGWWGRQCTGQSLTQDDVIREIYTELQQRCPECWEPLN